MKRNQVSGDSSSIPSLSRQRICVDLTSTPSLIPFHTSSSSCVPKATLSQLPTDMVGLITSFLGVKDRMALYSSSKSLHRDVLKFYQTGPQKQEKNERLGLFPFKQAEQTPSPFMKHASAVKIHLGDVSQRLLLSDTNLLASFLHLEKVILEVNSQIDLNFMLHGNVPLLYVCEGLRFLFSLPSVKHLVIETTPLDEKKLHIPPALFKWIPENQLEALEIHHKAMKEVYVRDWFSFFHRQSKLKYLSLSCDVLHPFLEHESITFFTCKIECCVFRVCQIPSSLTFVSLNPKKICVLAPKEARILLKVRPGVQTEFSFFPLQEKTLDVTVQEMKQLQQQQLQEVKEEPVCTTLQAPFACELYRFQKTQIFTTFSKRKQSRLKCLPVFRMSNSDDESSDAEYEDE